MKIAIVADWLTTMGGGEQVVMAMSQLYPQAPIYTSLHTGEFTELEGRKIIPTWLQQLPRPLRKHQYLLPFLPHAFSKLDLSSYDVIVSSCSAFSKCITKSHARQIHICYCHSPTRFLYNARQEYLSSYPLPIWAAPVRLILPSLLNKLTKLDQKAARQVDHFLCNSDYISERITKYYQRNALTINPCVDVDKFYTRTGAKTYFFSLGRFIPYKKFDLLVRTFAANKLPLKLAGTGPELENCRALAKSLNADNIEFLGFVEDNELPELYANSRAFLFPAEEDFGLTPVEAMASGVPVIAYNKGGATESVSAQSGIFFNDQTVDSLEDAINQFLEIENTFNAYDIRLNAEKFGREIFKQNLSEFIESVQQR